MMGTLVKRGERGAQETMLDTKQVRSSGHRALVVFTVLVIVGTPQTPCACSEDQGIKSKNRPIWAAHLVESNLAIIRA